jgi:hypothetical protein
LRLTLLFRGVETRESKVVIKNIVKDSGFRSYNKIKFSSTFKTTLQNFYPSKRLAVCFDGNDFRAKWQRCSYQQTAT